jgi:DNA-binding response OmpR family regulator/tetratricopeptide (TPR) repeat protein
MHEEAGKNGGWSLLLIEPDEQLARRLESELEERGLAVRWIPEPMRALRAAIEGDHDVIAVRVPLTGVDAVSICAALKEGPAPPLVLLLDAAGQSEAIEASLPPELRPDAVIPAPFEAGKLLIEIQALARSPDGTTPQRIGMRGPLLPELLVDLHQERETGVLEICAEDIRTNITVHRGRPVFAEGGSLRQTLGRLLLQRGEISEEDYVRVIERMTESLIRNESVRMGEVLVELGILAPADVFEALALQVREKILACFQWERFDFAFRPLDEVSQELSPFRCPPVEALVLEGIRTHFDAERLRPLLRPHAERFPVVAGDPGELALRFRMSATEQRLVHRIDGTRSLAALRRDGPLDSLHAGQLLAALSLSHELSLRETAARTTHDAATATPPAAAPRSRLARASTRPSPRAARAAEAADRARRSLDSLRRRSPATPGRAPKDSNQIRLEAEQAFNKGRRMIAQNLIGAALRELARAIELQGEQTEYVMFHAWAEYLGSRAEEPRMLAKARARSQAQKLLKQDRDSARAHSILGRLLYDEGELEAAEKHYRLALRSEAGDVEAQRGLRLIEGRRRR